MRLRNDALRAQLCTRFAAAAAALRDMELRVVFSDDSTLNKLKDEVTDFIYAVATGDYALLPTASPVAGRSSRAKRIIVIARDMTIAFIPLAVLVISRYAGLKIPTEIATWATVVTLVWAIVSITTIFDPAYKSKISDVSEMVSMIRGGSS